MRKQKLLVSALVIACTATTALAVTSCKDDHTHAYTDTITAPTCTLDGYTTHKCECGDTYVDTPVAALGHNYKVKVDKYPTAKEKGSKTLTCETCGETTTEDIEALTVSMPAVAEVLVNLIGSIDAGVEFDENTTMTTSNKDEYGEITDSMTIAIEKFETAVETKEGVLSAYLNAKMSTTNVSYENGEEISSETSTTEVTVYVNGDAISLEAVVDGTAQEESFVLSEVVFEAIAQAINATYDEAVGTVYAVSSLAGYLPELVELIDKERPTITEEYIAGLKTMFQAFGQDIIEESKEGENSVYTLNLSAVGHFLDEVKGETVASYIDKIYGAGSMKALTDFAVGLPAMTVREVVNSAIALGEMYNISVENVYYLVNLFAVQMGAEDFDIQAEIEKNYDKTLGGLILEANDGEDITIEEMTTTISDTLEMISALNIDAAYTMITGDEESLTEMLEALVDSLGDLFYANIKFDAEGNLLEASVATPWSGIAIVVEETAVSLAAEINGINATLVLSESGISFNATQEEYELANLEFLVTENGCEADLTIAGNDYLDFMFEIENDLLTSELVLYTNANTDNDETYPGDNTTEEEVQGYALDAEEEIKKLLEIDVSGTLSEGTLVSANATIQALTGEWEAQYDEEDNWIGDEYVETFGVVAQITYLNDNGDITATFNIENGGLIEIYNEKTETSAKLTAEVFDISEGVKEKLGEANVGYETVEGTTIYSANVYSDILEMDMYDITLGVKDDEIISFAYTENSLYEGHYASDIYYEDGVEYNACREYDGQETVNFNYTATENGGKWEIRTTVTEDGEKWIEYYNEDTYEWVEVDGTRESYETTDTHGYDITYSLAEGVANFKFTPVGEGGFGSTYVMSEIEVTLSADGFKYEVTTEEGNENALCEIKMIENGFEFIVYEEVDGVVGMDMSYTFTFVDGQFYIGADYTIDMDDNAIDFAGGITVWGF
ncbi:MAG: hypothetical protein E7371_03180 [Clostridiales bacterium]|nr:hypothetical protein [Clostridiales bacterium]